MPLRAGKTAAEEWTELGEIVEAAATGRRADSEITLFKSVGLAIQDIAAGALAVERARELGLGRTIEI